MGRATGSRDRAPEISLRPSPRARVGWAFNIIGSAHFVRQLFDEALPKLLFAIQEDPTFLESYRILAACSAHMGRLDEAHDVVKRLRAISPVVLHSAIHLRNLEHRELYLSGLRLAMGAAE